MPAENDELDVTHQTGVSDSQPGNISQPEITHTQASQADDERS